MLVSADQPRALPPTDIKAHEEFEVKLVYSVPKGEQGSWISLTTDHRGRLIASNENGSIFRLTLDDEGHLEKVETLDVPRAAAHGLLFAYDSLYVSVNRRPPNETFPNGIYRYRDTDGDDHFEEFLLLKELHGAGEHGPHGLRLGPDGLIYVVAGNATKLPRPIDPQSPHRNWADDLLITPPSENRSLPGGWVARTDRNGESWQLICGGLRNSYDIDFNLDGELFTSDADSESDIGTGWYRPTRVNHIISAAEFGWRYDSGEWAHHGKWPAHYPDSLGSVVDFGVGSPTGITFGTGAKFPTKYQRALFSGNWAGGRIYAVFMQPNGSSYTATFETFISGKPLPVTDIVINNDGAMYFITGGRSAQTGLYRVRYVGSEPTAPADPVNDPLAGKARQHRRHLESYHGKQNPMAIDSAWPYLASTDRALRYAARIAIEHQRVELWQDRALAEQRPVPSIEALLALTRSGDSSLQGAVIECLNKLPLFQLSEEQMLAALRVYALALVRLTNSDSANSDSVMRRLRPFFPGLSEATNQDLCRLLVYLRDPEVIDASLQQLRIATTQGSQMYYTFALSDLKQGWTLDQRRSFFNWLNLADQNYLSGAGELERPELDDRFTKLIGECRDRVVEQLDTEERFALMDVIEDHHRTNVSQRASTRRPIFNWQMADLIPDLQRLEAGRSLKSGKQAYLATQCDKCHRFGSDGSGTTGPDLTGVGNRFTPFYLLESLLLPSKVIPDTFQNSMITTDDGRVITGRIINDDGQTLAVRTHPFARELTHILVAKIEHQTPAPISEMPQGLINVLTKDEILDLIHYLRSGNDLKNNKRDLEKNKWLQATAYAVPKQTAPDGEGYFSIVEGQNRRLYIGTHANAVNSWLVTFDPALKTMEIAVDTHQAIGTDAKGFAAQAKIHTRNNVGKQTGKIYFGTKQGYPTQGETREDYLGGYPMVYDPKTGQVKVYPIPIPHHGINSIAPDETRGIAYLSTCADHRPGPGENAIFLVLDLETGKYRELMDTQHFYGFIVVDYLGRAYHPILGGDIARYDPRTKTLERLRQTIDGQPPSAASRLALVPKPTPINWDITPDGKTLYAQPMSGNALYAYDLTTTGNTLPGRYLGELIPGAQSTDCRALCVGPTGTAWCAVTEHAAGIQLLHVVRYAQGDPAPVDCGPVAIQNPDFTNFSDNQGNPLPFHSGFVKHPEGVTTTSCVILGVCEGSDGYLNMLALQPYTVLRISPDQIRK